MAGGPGRPGSIELRVIAYPPKTVDVRDFQIGVRHAAGRPAACRVPLSAGYAPNGGVSWPDWTRGAGLRADPADKRTGYTPRRVPAAWAG